MSKIRWVQVETTRHGKTIYYYRKGHGQARVRLPDPESKDFEAAYNAAASGDPTPHVRNIKPTAVELRKQRVERSMRRCLEAAKQRSREKGLAFDLDLNWALETVERANFCCALTGIEFFAKHASASFQNPYAPSFDRIVPSDGYVQSNVRIVVYAINFMLADWGTEVFEMVANSYRYQRQKRSKSSAPFTSDPRTF